MSKLFAIRFPCKFFALVPMNICVHLWLQEDRNPLLVAAEKGHANIVHLLIIHGANVDTKDKVVSL